MPRKVKEPPGKRLLRLQKSCKKFPTQHWTGLWTNNTIERLNREIKCRTKAVGAFPDRQSALMLVCARLRHVAGAEWGSRRYMNMDHLTKSEEDLLPDIMAG